MPVHRSACRADVHLFEVLYLSPAKLAVWNEIFVSVAFYHGRQVRAPYHLPVFCAYVEDLFPAEGAGFVGSPPLLYALHAEHMSAGQLAEVVHVASQTNNALPEWHFFVVLHFGHPSCYSGLDFLAFLIFPGRHIGLGKGWEGKWGFGGAGLGELAAVVEVKIHRAIKKLWTWPGLNWVNLLLVFDKYW